MTEQNNVLELQKELQDKQSKLTAIQERLKDFGLSESTVRALHKNQNELIADVQELQIKIQQIQFQ